MISTREVLPTDTVEFVSFDGGVTATCERCRPDCYPTVESFGGGAPRIARGACSMRALYDARPAPRGSRGGPVTAEACSVARSESRRFDAGREGVTRRVAAASKAGNLPAIPGVQEHGLRAVDELLDVRGLAGAR